MCVCMFVCVFAIIATPFNLELSNFITFLMWISKKDSQIFEKLFLYRVIACFLYFFKTTFERPKIPSRLFSFSLKSHFFNIIVLIKQLLRGWTRRINQLKLINQLMKRHIKISRDACLVLVAMNKMVHVLVNV